MDGGDHQYVAISSWSFHSLHFPIPSHLRSSLSAVGELTTPRIHNTQYNGVVFAPAEKPAATLLQ